jgi:hypothetical protein
LLKRNREMMAGSFVGRVKARMGRLSGLPLSGSPIGEAEVRWAGQPMSQET